MRLQTTMTDKVIIAAAGSGKTTRLVKEALKIKDKKVLITTFTIVAKEEIRSKIIKENHFLPDNITVQTWFSAMLQHGVRPYQNYFFDRDIKGLVQAEGRSARGTKQIEPNHYFNKHDKIYSDKILEFIFKSNPAINALVINRLSKIYTYLFIDEVQDLSGYDLDFLTLLFNSNINTLLVGDPRQWTYSTSQSARNKQYLGLNITKFFDKISSLKKDYKSHKKNYRSIPEICDFSNKLFPDYTKTQSGNAKTTEHDGIFLVRPTDVAQYIKQYEPMQLRASKATKEININFPVMNFGESKGQEFDRVLIYPTEPIKKWLKNNASPLPPTSRSKLYVAITRARYSVAFVYDCKEGETIDGVTNN